MKPVELKNEQLRINKDQYKQSNKNIEFHFSQNKCLIPPDSPGKPWANQGRSLPPEPSWVELPWIQIYLVAALGAGCVTWRVEYHEKNILYIKHWQTLETTVRIMEIHGNYVSLLGMEAQRWWPDPIQSQETKRHSKPERWSTRCPVECLSLRSMARKQRPKYVQTLGGYPK